MYIIVSDFHGDNRVVMQVLDIMEVDIRESDDLFFNPWPLLDPPSILVPPRDNVHLPISIHVLLRNLEPRWFILMPPRDHMYLLISISVLLKTLKPKWFVSGPVLLLLLYASSQSSLPDKRYNLILKLETFFDIMPVVMIVVTIFLLIFPVRGQHSPWP